MQDQRIPRSPRATHAGGYGVVNVMKVFDLLALRALSVPELGRVIGIEPRGMRRIMDRLRVENYVVQDGGLRRRYRPTLRLAAVGLEIVRSSPLLRLAEPVLVDLAERSVARPHLWIAGPGEPINIARPLMAADDDALAADAPGRARSVLDTDRDHLRSVALVRHDGRWPITAAVMDRGRVAAAVGVSGCPDLDLTRDVVDAAASLERELLAVVTS